MKFSFTLNILYTDLFNDRHAEFPTLHNIDAIVGLEKQEKRTRRELNNDKLKRESKPVH